MTGEFVLFAVADDDQQQILPENHTVVLLVQLRDFAEQQLDDFRRAFGGMDFAQLLKTWTDSGIDSALLAAASKETMALAFNALDSTPLPVVFRNEDDVMSRTQYISVVLDFAARTLGSEGIYRCQLRKAGL